VLNGLDLFSGIGGLSLALQPWVAPLAYCEIDPYARGVLLSRMRANVIGRAPIWDDVTTLGTHEGGGGLSRGSIDIVYGGFPCQDVSVAGARRGLGGERSGLYREIIRLVGEFRPRFVFLENVAAIRSHAWRVVQDLADLGFDSRWLALSAAEVGAPHKRDRWWLLAADAEQQQQLRHESGGSSGPHGQSEALAANDGDQGALANADSLRQLQQSRAEPDVRRRARDSCQQDLSFYWTTEPGVGRVAHGIPNRVDRLRALGNAVVPAQAREAFRRLMRGV
jgi:DNA (cytosine-5)-methyltransferase 1